MYLRRTLQSITWAIIFATDKATCDHDELCKILFEMMVFTYQATALNVHVMGIQTEFCFAVYFRRYQ